MNPEDQWIFVVLCTADRKVVEYDMFDDDDDEAHAYEKRLSEHPLYRDGARITTFVSWLDSCELAATTMGQDHPELIRQVIAPPGPNLSHDPAGGQMGFDL